MKRTEPMIRSSSVVVEIGHDPARQLGIYHILFNFSCHALGKISVVDGPSIAHSFDHQFLLVLVSHKLMAELLGVLVDVKAYLGDDSKPNVFGADD